MGIYRMFRGLVGGIEARLSRKELIEGRFGSFILTRELSLTMVVFKGLFLFIH